MAKLRPTANRHGEEQNTAGNRLDEGEPRHDCLRGSGAGWCFRAGHLRRDEADKGSPEVPMLRPSGQGWIPGQFGSAEGSGVATGTRICLDISYPIFYNVTHEDHSGVVSENGK